ncbi:hypothetical protein QR685DRAFT_596779 [Neurospora intermedia]|uniref:Uncharacterized protein n=1 Tax=Neurospora intermedia TaxID=5142 RepID=A0ABR3DK47_NEUIN
MNDRRVSRVQGWWQDPRTWFLSHPAGKVIVFPSILPRKEPTDLSQLADRADDGPDKAEKFADTTVVQIWGDTCAQAVGQIAKLCMCSA